ncbi:hypothetical protein [Psychrilyobacter sp.]|uniref:hypothetical protein n=1 Tax=Psychrilyobacter sp. TaxID=2586924 RepID=UPI0030166C97
MNEIKSSNYYVDKNTTDNEDHIVHREDCKEIPSPAKREYLGNFDCCEDAIEKAKQIFLQSIGCVYCSKKC